jgi:hypothetical protein
MSAVSTLERPRASAPAVAPRLSLAEQRGIRIGRVVIKKNLSPGGSDENVITLSAGIWPAETERKEQCQAA